ncbi:MAG: TlpA family protein disulfide reductase [Actinomycetota bacterium]|nr:TlpA family protein disulfide reductase [Actinomycetota bacterium]
MVPSNELDGHRTRPRSRRAFLLALVALAVGVALARAVFTPAGDQAGPPERLPDFTLPLLSGDGKVSGKSLAGSPVVINFWASWCLPCREEAPLLERAWRTYRDEGLVVIGVNARDSAADAKGFVREFDITYPVIVDDDLDLMHKMSGIVGWPQTFFVKRDGHLSTAPASGNRGRDGATVDLGALESAALERRIEALL